MLNISRASKRIILNSHYNELLGKIFYQQKPSENTSRCNLKIKITFGIDTFLNSLVRPLSHHTTIKGLEKCQFDLLPLAQNDNTDAHAHACMTCTHAYTQIQTYTIHINYAQVHTLPSLCQAPM